MTSYFSGFYPAETADGAKGSAAFTGATNIAILQLYKRSATTLSNSDKPNGVVTYTFATAVSDLSTVTNGWTSTIPAGSDPLYVVGATAASSDPTDTIAVNEWSTPVILVQNGTGGLNTATVFLFKRGNTSTPPAVPTQSVTYTFASGIALGSSSVGNTVSPYLDGWSQTAPDSAGNRYLFMITGTAISTGASDTILTSEWSTVRILAQDGAQGYTGYLTNESHTLPASSAGVVSAYTGASGEFKVFLDGVGDISSSFSLSTVSNPQTLTVAYTGSTYTISGGFDSGEDTAVITIRATGSGAYSGVILDKVFSLGKSKSGVDGSSSKLLGVSTSRQLISYDAAGALSPTTQTTTISANKQNTTATVNWTIQDTLGNVLTPATYLSATTGDSITMTAANFQSAISVNASEGVSIIGTLTDGITLSDRVTIMKVKAGANGTDGTDGTDGIDGLNSATVFLYQRATSAPAVPSTNSTYTFSTKTLTGTLGSWTQNIPAGTNPIYVISATAVSTTTTDVIGTSEWSVPSILAQNGVDGSNGLNNAVVFLYQRAASTPAAPTGTFTYTFSNGALSGGTPGSWTQAIPATNGNPLWVIAATASSTTNTDSIPAAEFSAPVTLVQDGSGGVGATSALLTRESQSLFAYADGTVVSFVTANGNLKIYSGNNDVTNSATAFSATASGCTGTINTADNTPINGQVKGYYQITAMSADTATLTLSATYSGTTFTKIYTITKSRGGYEIVSTLPATNLFVGRVVFLTTDNKLYRYTGSAWVTSVPATDISGTLADAQIAALAASKVTGTLSDSQLASISAAKVSGTLTDAQIADIAAAKITGQLVSTQLADASISTAKFASGIEPVTKVTSVPVTQSTSTVFNTTDGKLYRWNGTSYVASVPAADVAGQITNAQIAAVDAVKVSGTLTDAQLAAISAAKVTGTLADTQIAAISATKVTGTLADTQIAAISAAKITGSITSTQITDGAISTAKLAAGAITAGKIAADTITANEIAANAITATELAAGSVTAGKIAADSITSNEIAANAITASEIAANAVTAGKIAADSITANEIAANAITASEIAANAITAGKIAADSITANEIAANAITASEIAANAVTAGKIAADSITANEIASNAITVNELAANAVTAAKIAANTITSAQIAADTITAGNIAAGAITTSELSAGAVTAEKITVTSRGDSVILNPGFEEASAADSTLPARWTRNRVWGGSNTTAFRDTAEVLSGSTSLALIPGAGLSADSIADLVPVSPGEQWYLACKAKSSGTNAGSSPGFYFRVRGGASPSAIGIELYIGVENLTVPTSWTKYEGIVTIPSGMTWAAPILLNYQANTGAKISVDDVEFRKVVTSASIADGAITAAKIQASSITSAQIAADTITAGNIAANAITATELSAGAVTAGKIAADTITANEIAANAITATELAAGAVTAGKIAAGSIVAADIAADTITAANIAANAITASEIATNAITADKVNAGAITAAKISVTELSSITATIGTLRTATTGARTEIKDNLIEIFDASNVRRVRLGVW